MCKFAAEERTQSIMTGMFFSRTPAYDRIHFATMALESGAKRLGITPLDMYRRLKRQDLINQRLMRHYDLLHTQSLDYVAEDIAEALQNWEAQTFTAEQALGQSRHKPVNHQLCITSQSVIDCCLKFVESISLTPETL